MNILITGIHGFVGSNLVESLADTHTVYGLDIVTPDKKGVMHTYTWQQLVDIPPVDAVIHLAGMAHDTRNERVASDYFKVNTDLTRIIFDWFKQSQAKRFIFFSSVKAAADRVEGAFLTEEVEPSPVGPYGESKIAAEKYIMEQVVDLPSDRQVYTLRPCMIHGPGNKGNLNLLYQVVSKGIPWPLGAFENLRSFTSIDNLCYAITGLLTKSVCSGIYNMGDDEPLSTNVLIELMARSLNRPVRIVSIPVSWICRVAKVGDLLHLPLDSHRLQKLTENYVVSNAKIKRALEIDRFPIQAKEGLLKTFRSF